MMNDFKYFRYNRQTVFDINEKISTSFDFEGSKKNVYDNVNLSIFVDDYCNADCKFCVAQLRYENAKQMYCKPKLDNDEEYFARLDKVLEYIKPLNVSVSITGGEPTKSKRLVPILRLLEKHDMRKRTITSNGSGLFDRVEGKTILDHLIENNIQHLNISRTHYDEDVNRKIMDYKTGYCSNDMLADIIPYSLSRGLRPRLSSLLLQEGINNLSEMKKYISFYEKMGIDNIIFRELMDYDKTTMINQEKMNYCEANKVLLNTIWEDMDNDESFAKIKNILGYYYYVEIYKHNDTVICSESANLVNQKLEKDNNKDYIYEMVFHPNGNLNGSWVDNEEILLEYNSSE